MNFLLFRVACGANEKDFITKNEFSSFLLNEKDLLSILLNQKNATSSINQARSK